MNRFEEVSDQKSHEGYQKKEDIFKHSVDFKTAKVLVLAYTDILKNMFGFEPGSKGFTAIDIGAGAGMITQCFNTSGYVMTALEKSEDALKVFKEFNPTIPLVDGDLRSFYEPEKYNFIFSREVYLFTRVNSFTDQYRILGRLIDSLKDRGVLMLVMSQRSWPHCAEIQLINRYLKNEKKVKIRIFSELILKRIPILRLNYWLYKSIELLLWPAMYLFIKRGYANHLVIVYQK